MINNTISLDDFWNSSLHDVSILSQQQEKIKEIELENIRYLAFTIYSSSVNAMNGKKNFGIKKPEDLFTLPSDVKRNKSKIDKVVIPTKEHALSKIQEAHNRK